MKENTLQRTCMLCGKRKPAAAFHVIDNTGIHDYHALCDECRSKTKGQDTPIDDEIGRGKTELRIGAKERVEIEKVRQQQNEHKLETDLKQKAQQEITSKTTAEKTETAQQEKQKQIFNPLFLRTLPPEKKPITQPQDQKNTVKNAQHIKEKKQAESTQKTLEEKEQKEQKLKENTSMFVANQTPMVSYDNVVIRNLFSILGASAPGAKNILGEKQSKNAPEKNTHATPAQSTEKKQSQYQLFNSTSQNKNTTSNQTSKADKFIQIINDHWGPRKPGR